MLLTWSADEPERRPDLVHQTRAIETAAEVKSKRGMAPPSGAICLRIVVRTASFAISSRSLGFDRPGRDFRPLHRQDLRDSLPESIR